MVAAQQSDVQLREPPENTVPGGSSRSTRSEMIALIALFVLCIVSRLITTIYYVEDIDSLHFALSMVDFDVARLQPHFPGYVVFVALARVCTTVGGSFAVGFALVGGIATFLLVTGMLSLTRWRLTSLRGAVLAALIVGNGMLWLYGNRYMPDLLGVALLIWCMRDLTSESPTENVRGAFIVALLAGTRLSYIPFIAPIAIAALFWKRGRVASLAMFGSGVILWAIPLIASMGFTPLLSVAMNQTSGHFDEYGGTVRTEPDLLLRAARMIEGVWADALGGAWTRRGAWTIVASVATLAALAFSIQYIRTRSIARRWQLIGVGVATYVVWIFLFQNVIHHSRHLLPLVPFALAVVALGVAESTRTRYGFALLIALIVSTTAIGTTLAIQHRRASAIAQTGNHLRSVNTPLIVISTGLVNYYLASTGVRARFIDVDSSDIDAVLPVSRDTMIVSVGDYRERVRRSVVGRAQFYHNPYVNRIWPVIEVYEYTELAKQR